MAEASALLMQLDLAGRDPELIAELYLKIETARVEARQLSASRRGEIQQSVVSWCGVDPWNLDASLTPAHMKADCHGSIRPG